MKLVADFALVTGIIGTILILLLLVKKPNRELGQKLLITRLTPADNTFTGQVFILTSPVTASSRKLHLSFYGSNSICNQNW